MKIEEITAERGFQGKEEYSKLVIPANNTYIYPNIIVFAKTGEKYFFIWFNFK